MFSTLGVFSTSEGYHEYIGGGGGGGGDIMINERERIDKSL